MKSTLRLLICCLLPFFMSCSPDDGTDGMDIVPKILSEGFVGSSWRCTSGRGLDPQLDYAELRFISATAVQGWGKESGISAPELFFAGTYVISGSNVTVTADGESFIAKLNNSDQLVTNIDGGGECVFTKQ